MSNTHKGVILEIRETKLISDTFQKRDFVVDQVFTGSYGESHKIGVFSLTQEKCSLIDQFSVGDKVIVSFDVDYRAWYKDGVHQLDKDGEKSYFPGLKAWKIEPIAAWVSIPEQATAAEPAPPPERVPAPGNDFNPNPPSGDGGPDDLPF